MSRKQLTPLDMNSNKVTSLATPTASTDASTKGYVDTGLAGMGYWTIKADGASTFPARSTVPAFWTGPVIYDSTVYLNHANPSDMVAGDQHLKRTS